MSIPLAALVNSALTTAGSLIGPQVIALLRTEPVAVDRAAGMSNGLATTTETLTAVSRPYGGNWQGRREAMDDLRTESLVVVSGIGTLTPRIGDMITVDGVRYAVIDVLVGRFNHQSLVTR